MPFHGNDRVLLIDDLVATGGTANAAIDLIRKSGARWWRQPLSSTCPISAELRSSGRRASRCTRWSNSKESDA